MSNLNVVALTGRLTADVELRHTPSDISVCNFTLAVGGYKQDETDFIDCMAWRNTAEFISRYFEKGSMLALSGHLHTDTYEAKDGSGKRKRTEVVVDTASFCEGRKNGGADIHPTGQKAQTANSNAKPAYSSGDTGDYKNLPDSDDLPF